MAHGQELQRRSERATRGEAETLKRRIRALLYVFIVGLVLSGVTAFPLTWEVNLLARLLHTSGIAATIPVLGEWVATVQAALVETDARYPFLAYGTDWLAFGHIVIALFFIAPLRDPVRNVAVLEAGLWACAGVIPLALVCGAVRGIPWWWQLIDCSFGAFGAIPLLFCLRDVRRLEALRVQ